MSYTVSGVTVTGWDDDTIVITKQLTDIDSGAVGTTAIASNAFYNNGFTFNLSNLTFPTNLDTIGNNAYRGATGITGSLVLPDSLETIGTLAFRDCGFNGTLTLPANLTVINNEVFRSCKFTGTLTLPINLESIGNSAFNQCSGFTGTLTIPSTVTRIGTYAFVNSGFSGHLDLSNLTLTPSKINDASFRYCDFTSLDLPVVANIGTESFQYTPLESVYFRSGCTLQNNSFSGNATATVYVSSGSSFTVGTTPSSAFSETVNPLSRFFSKWRVYDYPYPNLSSHYPHVGPFTFNYSTVINVTFYTFSIDPDYVHTIEFFNASDEPIVGDSITTTYNAENHLVTFNGSIPSDATSLTLNGHQMLLELGDGYSFNTEKTIITGWIPTRAIDTQINDDYNLVNAQITSIQNDAFLNKTFDLGEELILPSQLVSIGSNAYNTTGISGSILLPITLEVIGENAFIGCDFTNIYFQDGCTLQNSSFTNGNNTIVHAYDGEIFTLGTTDTVPFSNSVNPLSSIFSKWRLYNYPYPDSTTYFTDGSTGPFTLNFVPGEVTFFSYSPTQLAKSAYSITVDGVSTQFDVVYLDHLVTFDVYIYYGTTLTLTTNGVTYTMYLNDGLPLDRYIYDDTGIIGWGGGSTIDKQLTEFELSGITEIKYQAFFGKNYVFNLSNLTFPPNLTTIEGRAYRNATGITGSLVLPDSLETILYGAFANCGFNGTLTLPTNLVVVDYGTFNGCNFTGNLTIPTTLTNINQYAFTGSNFTNIYFQEGCTLYTNSFTIPNSSIVHAYADNSFTVFTSSTASFTRLFSATINPLSGIFSKWRFYDYPYPHPSAFNTQNNQSFTLYYVPGEANFYTYSPIERTNYVVTIDDTVVTFSQTYANNLVTFTGIIPDDATELYIDGIGPMYFSKTLTITQNVETTTINVNEPFIIEPDYEPYTLHYDGKIDPLIEDQFNQCPFTIYNNNVYIESGGLRSEDLTLTPYFKESRMFARSIIYTLEPDVPVMVQLVDANTGLPMSDPVESTGSYYIGNLRDGSYYLRIVNDQLIYDHTIIADICFVKGTIVKTDQGLIEIDKITNQTLNRKPITVTKTIHHDPYLVKVSAGAFGELPTRDTYMSLKHHIIMGVPVMAKNLINGDTITEVPCDDEYLYNVLVDTHTTMRLHGMLVETLDPNSIVGLFHRAKLSPKQKNKMIRMINEEPERAKMMLKVA